MKCSACGTENRDGRRFCSQCGAALELACPACGTSNEAADRFCGGCGATLAEGAAAPARPGVPAADGGSERRLVSVLFADLVGFTPLAEHRDPEEVRELLSRYFEQCQSLIGRYGGTVGKFIGDAVMAVWGAPAAHEDDPERAVRAALDLCVTVSSLGAEIGVPGLQVRVGVLTGSAAVDVDAVGEGMVLGDTVNTASRLQSLAAPGTVLVDDVTRRASEAAIAYEDAGVHAVKGREQPVHAWTALRVVAGAGGARRAVGLEAPFVGRERELGAIIEAGDGSAHEGRARLVAVVGDAGSGKSRLVWEFFKHLDGIQEARYWHQGRAISYGEGVAYWALAEMVRARSGIAEEEDPSAARGKLRATVEEFVADERERRLVEPRLAHLLRLEERAEADRADLFSGWRLFFERLSENAPVTLVFEDLQWADSGLLDFIDYLMEWSAEFPIFVLALGRPELAERRPAWRPTALEPLDPAALVRLLDGLAPGLPEALVNEIIRRAEGIPLYAVETVRMLQDRGVLVADGTRYVLVGDASDLEVPETLHALLASRLDGLAANQRSLLQDASVLGRSFTAAGVAALAGLTEAEAIEHLDGLVAKQILARDDDPRSPERGQYVFLQALLRTVAYGTLSRRARKARHVAAARHLERTWPGEGRDIADVLASHYLDAIRAEPDADDAGTLRAAARETLTAAGRASASLALGPESDRYFEQAAELAEGDVERATLFELAGAALSRSGDMVRAERRLRRSLELRRDAGERNGGQAAVILARVLRIEGRLEEARVLLAPFRDPEADTDAITRAEALAGLAAVQAFGGAPEEAAPLLEEALATLEAEGAGAALVDALSGRAVYLMISYRFEEATAVLAHAVELAARHGFSEPELRARHNLSGVLVARDRLVEAIAEIDAGLIRARERGDRFWETLLVVQRFAPLVTLGRWEEAQLPPGSAGVGEPDVLLAPFLAQIAAARGDEEALARLAAVAAAARNTEHMDQRASARVCLARCALERLDPAEALAEARSVFDDLAVPGETVAEGYAIAIEAALAAGEEAPLADLEAFVADLPPVRATPLLRAGRDRVAAALAASAGDDRGARRHEDHAIAALRALGARPLLARALAERAQRRNDPAARAEARAIYLELGASRWLARLDETATVPA